VARVNGAADTRAQARRFAFVLGVLAAGRVAVALAAVAAEGTKLPAIPTYRWRGLEGDANGYYATAREAVSAARSPATAAIAAAALLVGAAAVLLLQRAGRPLWTQLLAAGAALAAAATAVVAAMAPSGASVVGWPLVWSVALAPVRAFGEPSLDVAWSLGVGISLACVAVTTIACGLLGKWASGSEAVGISAAALFAAWPLLTGTLAGEQAWENGTWLVDTGLHLYTEPLSTALVVVALALLVRPESGEGSRVGSGLLLGFATVVKLTNGVIAVALAPLVAWRHGQRSAAIYAAGGLLWAPLVAVYWDKGYVAYFGGRIAAIERPWGLSYAADNWTDSLLFTPTVLAALAPLAIVGCVSLRDRWALAVLLTPVVTTALVYTVYDGTVRHPRFLFVALPSVFVLEAAGAVEVVRRVRRRQGTAPAEAV
jgi:hypothetical protein